MSVGASGCPFAIDISCGVEARAAGGASQADNAQSAVAGVPHITLAALNLRAAPNTASTRLAVAPLGAMVQVTDVRDGAWFAVSYNGMNGFMAAEFLLALRVPEGVDTGDLPGIELITWDEAHTAIPVRTVMRIIDVRSGISWQVARMGGDLHADVETVTAQDTALMHRAFDYTWTWNPRPVWVVVGGRTFPGSLGGMPHGIVTNHTNNVNGHFCLHFFGSRVHGSEVVDQRHHDAVFEAYFAFMTETT